MLGAVGALWEGFVTTRAEILSVSEGNPAATADHVNASAIGGGDGGERQGRRRKVIVKQLYVHHLRDSSGAAVAGTAGFSQKNRQPSK